MKYKIIAFVLSIALFMGCKTENVEPVTLVGKWNFKSLHVKTYKNGEQISDVTSTDFKDEYLIFNQSGIGTGVLNKPGSDFFKSDFKFIYAHPELTLIHENAGGANATYLACNVTELSRSVLNFNLENKYAKGKDNYTEVIEAKLAKSSKELGE